MENGAWRKDDEQASSRPSAQGCSGDTKGQAGSRPCFFGQQVALTDDLVFRFAFSSNAVQALDPHVKVEFMDNAGKKVGDLLAGLGLMGLLARRKCSS